MPHGKCSRAQGAQGALESSFAAFVVSQYSGRRDGRHFHGHAAYDYNREYKSRWSVTTIRMAYVARPYNPRSLNTCLLKV